MALRIPLVAFACLSAFNIPSLFAGESELLPPAQYFYQAAKNLGGKTEINDGQVTIWNDNLIILELGADELVPGNLFDLEGSTLRFSPDGTGYRVQTIPFQGICQCICS